MLFQTPVTHKMFKEAFADNALSLAQPSELFKRFKQVRMSVDDGERPGDLRQEPLPKL
jgi:hypothetical protein